jgi:peptide/nickel transport system substrate-binding protein
VTIKLQYNPDHYGKSSGDEYAMVKDQLEKSGLFKVDLQSTEWVTYNTASKKDSYPVFQLGWFPDFSDADNYLTPFFVGGGFMNNHYSNPEVEALIAKQLVTADKSEREKAIQDAQNLLAKDISTLPLLQGAQVAVTGTSVKGVDSTLDASFKFRLGTVSK